MSKKTKMFLVTLAATMALASGAIVASAAAGSGDCTAEDCPRTQTQQQECLQDRTGGTECDGIQQRDRDRDCLNQDPSVTCTNDCTPDRLRLHQSN